jgi:predicted Zn-dependent peptidase
MKLYNHTLQNGIRLIHRPAGNHVSHAGIFINTGSRDEKDNEYGMAHFIEHVIFKGTAKRNVYHILSRLENVGADLNAFTTKEETCIYASFLNSFYERTLELIKDITFNSTFPEKELEKEKEVIFDEINSYKDSPSEEIFDDFEEQVFAGHPIGRNILGNPKNIKKFTRKDVLKFMGNNYHTDQMVICSVGKIDFKRLVRIVEKYFSDIAPNIRKYNRKKFTEYLPSQKYIEKKTFQNHCLTGNVAYSIMDEKSTAFALLNNILGGPGLNSRLNLAIREKYGYAYNLESNYMAYSDTGIFSVYLGTESGYLERSVSLIYKELKKLREVPLGVLQIKRAKQQLMGQLAISNESNLNKMMHIGRSYLLKGQADSIDEIYSKIENVKAYDIQELANDVFSPGKLSMLVYKAK